MSLVAYKRYRYKFKIGQRAISVCANDEPSARVAAYGQAKSRYARVGAKAPPPTALVLEAVEPNKVKKP